MGRIILSIAVVVNILLTGLMVGSTVADSIVRETSGGHQQVHRRRPLQASVTPLPDFKSGAVCGGLGPACPDGMHIECVVGGVVGCICALVRSCQPTVSGCTLFNGASATPCGF